MNFSTIPFCARRVLYMLDSRYNRAAGCAYKTVMGSIFNLYGILSLVAFVCRSFLMLLLYNLLSFFHFTQEQTVVPSNTFIAQPMLPPGIRVVRFTCSEMWSGHLCLFTAVFIHSSSHSQQRLYYLLPNPCMKCLRPHSLPVLAAMLSRAQLISTLQETSG